MYIKLAFTWAPGLPETKFTIKDNTLTVDDYLFTFPNDDGEAVGIAEESGGKIIEAHRADGENYATIHYLCKSSSHPLATSEYMEVTETDVSTS